MEGFTYNGVHCSAYNVYYIPDHADKWFASPEFDIYQKDIGWRHGGYYFGNAVNIRTIELKCYFEEISVATREKIRRWLGRDTSGTLVFDDKPFVYWNVRPASVIPGNIYLDTNESYSGTFTIKFTAEDPFGYLTRKSGITDDHAEDYCGIIATASMPSAPTTSSTSFDVYNPGTECCGLNIVVSGTASQPVRFVNNRNKTQCVISSFPSNNLKLDINADTGNILTYVSSPSVGAESGFAYHDRGFIRLEPDTTTNGTSTKNQIVIQEKNSSGNWTTPSTLSLASIAIDYNPRLL